MNIKWNGTMQLKNVQSYLAQALDVPLAAIDLRFRFVNPKTQKITEIGGDALNRPIRVLRTLWMPDKQ